MKGRKNKRKGGSTTRKHNSNTNRLTISNETMTRQEELKIAIEILERELALLKSMTPRQLAKKKRKNPNMITDIPKIEKSINELKTLLTQDSWENLSTPNPW